MSANGGTNPSKADTDVSEWRKSSFSGVMECVELAHLGDEIGVRDSKQPDADHLALTFGQMAGLVARIKAGELDSFLR